MPVDWDRWHDLLDIKAKRALTRNEEQEYKQYARIVARLDAEEGRAADAALDNLVEGHKRVIASIRLATAAFHRVEAEEIRELRRIVEEVDTPECHEWTTT